MTATEPKDPMNRRSATGIIFGSALALGSGLATLIVGFLANALRRRSAEPWVLVGPASEMSDETYQRVVVPVARTHAWIEKTVPVTIYVKDQGGGNSLAMLSVCPHLGCSVKWNAEEDLFQCPCHRGIFDAEGNVVEGPPPGPLTRLETKIEEESLYIRLPDSGAAL